MEVEDFYTGEKKEIVIPEGCIMIDEEKLSYGNYALIDDDEDIDGLNAKIVVDFFPNKPKRFSDIPLFKSSKEGQFKVVVIKDKYFKWVDLNRRQKQNDIKRLQNIEKQQAIYDNKCNIKSKGDIFRKDSKIQQAISYYNMALQVDYKTVNKWFKLYCIDIDLQALDGLINIYHKQNNIEKERECIERAISLASLNSRHEKELSQYKHRLEKLLGTYKEKEIPPESHMNVVYTDLCNDLDIYNSPIVNGETNAKKRRKIREYFNRLIKEGRSADNEFDYKTAADIYERLIAEKYRGLYWTSMYDRLIAMYFNYKLYEDEVRIIKLALQTFEPQDEVLKDGSIETRYRYHNKRLEQLEQRLVAAQKRLQSSKKSEIKSKL